MSENVFCAKCGDESPQAYSMHCDSCNKLLRTGRVGSVPQAFDTDHPFVELMAEGCRFRICADCIHKIGQPFVGVLIKLGERVMKDGQMLVLEVKMHTPMAAALIVLEEQRMDRETPDEEV